MSNEFSEMNDNSSADYEINNRLVFYAGPSIAIFFPLLGFIAFVINRSLRIKRQHIISINICLSVIIYNIGFLVSMLSSRNKIDEDALSVSCIAGSITVIFGWFCVHFWILANWIYLSFIIRQRVSKHISQFLIKSTLPTYGCAVFFLFVLLIMTITQQSEQPIYNQYLCWFNFFVGSTTEWTFSVAAAISVFGVLICAFLCCFELICKNNKNSSVSTMKKNKRSLVRLSVLTLIVMITSSTHLAWWTLFTISSNDPNTEKELHKRREHYNWLKIFHTVFIGIEGIIATLYLIVPSDDFQSLLGYCTAMIKCQDPTAAQNRNFGSSARSSKQLENNNVMDVRDSVASEERPVKIMPRDEISKDFSNAPKELDLYAATFPMEKNRAKAKASTMRVERNGQQSVSKQKDTSSTPGVRSSTKKKRIRASFRLPTKSSSSSGSGPSVKSPAPTCTSPLNK